MGEHHSAHYLLDKPSESDYEMVMRMLGKSNERTHELLTFLFDLLKTEGMPESTKKMIAHKLVSTISAHDTRLAEVVDYVDDADTKRAIAYGCATATTMHGSIGKLWEIAMKHGSNETRLIVSRKIIESAPGTLRLGKSVDTSQTRELLRLVVVCCSDKELREQANDILIKQLI